MTYKTTITDNYILITSDEEIKEGDCYLSKISDDVFKRVIGGHWIENYDKKMYQKIIAYLPLNNAPQLEGVPLLPPLPSGDEKYRFSEEDMRKVFKMARTHIKIGINKVSRVYSYNEDEIIQSLSQPKMPIGFKCEIREYNFLNIAVEGEEPKIINGVMQGEWIY